MELNIDEKLPPEKPGTPEQSLADDNDTADFPKSSEDIESNDEHITGLKLWTVLAALTVVMFLVMLDMSIIVTVLSTSNDPLFLVAHQIARPFLESRPTFTHSQILGGMEVLISWRGA